MFVMRFTIAIIGLFCCGLCSGQNKPLSFSLIITDSLVPEEPRWWTLTNRALSDTVDYRGRRISKETILGVERHFDTLGRLVKLITRNDTAIISTQTWEYFSGGIHCTRTDYPKYFGYSSYSEFDIFPANPNYSEQPPRRAKRRELALGRMINGEWKMYYCAEYDSAGKILSQTEDANLMPNAYISGVLLTEYSYDVRGRCIGYVTTNDSGMCLGKFRCSFNAQGQIAVWHIQGFPWHFTTLDSLLYDESGNVTYAYHQSGSEQAKEFLFEYDAYGKLIRCEEKVDGELIWEHVYYRERGLLLSATTIQHNFGRPTTVSKLVRHYEFFE